MEQVALHILFAQRKCGYPGEFAPEALEIMDEFAYDDNGVWLHEKLEKYKKEDSSIERLEIIEVMVDYTKIREIMSPKHQVSGEIGESTVGGVPK
jgi:hypothetical protein